MVALRPQLKDAAAEEPELDAELHEYAHVAIREGLERDHGTVRVGSTAVFGGVCEPADAPIGQELDRLEHAGPVLAMRDAGRNPQGRIGKKGENVGAK